MSLTATWINLEIIILSKTEEGKYNITFVGNFKSDTNELIYKTEAESQTLKTNLWLPKEKVGGNVN